jgi:hypothetical protein
MALQKESKRRKKCSSICEEEEEEVLEKVEKAYVVDPEVVAGVNHAGAACEHFDLIQ